MKYYKAILNLSQEPNALTFDSPINITGFELKKLNYGDTISVPNPIIFSIDLGDGIQELDVNLSISGSIIVSAKFKNLFSNESLRFYPIKTDNYETKEQYYILEILDFCDCIDENNTKITYWTEANTSFNKRLVGNYKSLFDIHLIHHKIETNIFRLKKYSAMIIVNQYFVDIFEENHCSGWKFASI